MKNNKFAIITLIFSIITNSCSFGLYFLQVNQESVEERAKSIKIIEENDLPETEKQKYSFLIFADPHYKESIQNRKDEDFLNSIKSIMESEDESLHPLFAICLGDIADTGTEKEFQNYIDFTKKIQNLAKECLLTEDFKIFNLLGNHDLYHNGWKYFKENLYPNTSYYKFSFSSKFNSEKISYYFLDTANGTLGINQYQDLKNQFKKDDNKKIIFSHYPFFHPEDEFFKFQNTKERNKILNLFAQSKVKFIFEGHTSSPTIYDNSSFTEWIIPSPKTRYGYTLVTIDEISENIKAQNIFF